MTATFNAALLEAHKELATIDFPKTANNPHFSSKYCPLDVVMERVLPVLHKNGIALIQQVSTLDSPDGPQPALTTRLQLSSGDGIESTMLLLAQKANAQAQGAAVTYARRYALQTILGITPEDDVDGNAAGTRSTGGSQATEPSGPAPF